MEDYNFPAVQQGVESLLKDVFVKSSGQCYAKAFSVMMKMFYKCILKCGSN